MSGPQIIDCEQGTEEWFRVRSGMPTASEFATVMAKGKGGEDSKTRRTYLYKLAGEIITGEPMESYSNVHMERGKAMEAEARSFYSFMRDADPEQIGFVVNGRKGCSPDSFIGSEGMLEIKTALPHIMIECMVKDEFPPQHKAQCQGALWVCEREWIDLVVYWPRMPPFVKRAYRDNGYIANLAGCVEAFNAELDELVERINRYGREPRPLSPTEVSLLERSPMLAG